MKSTTTGWQTAIHPGDPPAPPKRWRSILTSRAWGEPDRLPDAFRTSKHDTVGIGFSVSRSVLESHRGPEGTERPARTRRGHPNARHERPVIVNPPLVSVVDDDESVRESLPDLLRELGFVAEAFASGEQFLASDYIGQTKCLLLDIAMPGMTGPDLQRELRRRGQEMPIVYITARRDETVHQRMLGQGAVDCLFKPFRERALLDAVTTALQVG